MLIFEISSPPLAIAECGFSGEFGFIPTTYGTETVLRKLEWGARGNGTHQTLGYCRGGSQLDLLRIAKPLNERHSPEQGEKV